jgi:hypothetical protein
MSMYTPNKWMVIKINSKNPHYRVFASWSGGYLDGDSWKLNSGITKATLVDGFYHFEGSSGSVYKCREGMYGGTGFSYGVLNGMIKDAKATSDVDIDVLPAETNFLELNYE